MRKQMHQTTIRFDSELWGRIDAESRRIGVSAAQYIRDATLVRLTREADWALGPSAAGEPPVVPFPIAAAAISASDVIGTESSAVWAQARQARERARDLRDDARRLAETRPLPRRGDGRGTARSVEGSS